MKRLVTHLSLCLAAAVMAAGCTPVRHNLPPEQRMLEPGPGVGGPGPGVLGPQRGGMPGGPMGGMPGGPMGGMPGGPMGGMPGGMMGGMPGGQMPGGPMPGGPMPGGPMPGGSPESGIAQAQYCGPEGGPMGGMMPAGMMGPPPTVQVTFGKPESMHVRYSVGGPGMFDSEPLVVPARQYFPQGGLYRLKLTNIMNREGVELYPTVELAYANPRTGAYLAHNSIPVQFTDEDLDQVLTGNFVTKVIYLPDPDFQGPALAGIDTLVSTRLDPGVDPIVEADRRGSILAIIRLGDKDIELGQGAGGEFIPGMAMVGNGLPMAFAPSASCGEGSCGPSGNSAPYPTSLPGPVSGVNIPQYGMPITGTPIGLPGPPHIPLGSPAGLQKHVMKNHTRMNMPQPVSKMKINVRQNPGYSYPNPVSRININEQNINPGTSQHRPLSELHSQRVQ